MVYVIRVVEQNSVCIWAWVTLRRATNQTAAIGPIDGRGGSVAELARGRGRPFQARRRLDPARLNVFNSRARSGAGKPERAHRHVEEIPAHLVGAAGASRRSAKHAAIGSIFGDRKQDLERLRISAARDSREGLRDHERGTIFLRDIERYRRIVQEGG